MQYEVQQKLFNGTWENTWNVEENGKLSKWVFKTEREAEEELVWHLNAVFEVFKKKGLDSPERIEDFRIVEVKS